MRNEFEKVGNEKTRYLTQRNVESCLSVSLLAVKTEFQLFVVKGRSELDQKRKEVL